MKCDIRCLFNKLLREACRRLMERSSCMGKIKKAENAERASAREKVENIQRDIVQRMAAAKCLQAVTGLVVRGNQGF